MIHKNVERIRSAKGVTKTHLAKQLNMSLQGYRYLENGETRLDAERLKIIARSLGEEPAIFFDSKLTDSVIERINNQKQEVI